jgi:glucoamylase
METYRKNLAPGRPGIPARWTSSAKSGVGTALSATSRVWFTLSHGIFNEIYYPRVDQACTRDFGMLVTDGQDFFSEEKRHTQTETRMLSDGVPIYHLTNTCNLGRYRIEKDILSDPQRDVVLQRTQFTPLAGDLRDYHLYALLAPHLGNQGADNTAWVDSYKGIPMLFANRENLAIALACSVPWLRRSAGYVGVSDGWQDISRHKEMAWEYKFAQSGNVALTGEIDLQTSQGKFTLALGFGINPDEAAQRALASLQDGFERARKNYIHKWQTWQRSLLPLENKNTQSKHNIYRVSTAVLRSHEAKRFPGGLIASLSVPWGNSKGDDDLGGYHLVWPRDLVESAGGLLAAGAGEDVRRVLDYLQVTQEADGHWPQNMWLDGRPYWNGVQMDETALPVLLVDLAYRDAILKKEDLPRYWPMVYRAVGFLVQNGPVTPQDRWEEDPGYSPFTLATEITALLVGADLADLNGEQGISKYLRETADSWNANIERWIYVTGTDLARKVGVSGYYVRIAPVEQAEAASPFQGFVPIKNRPPDQSNAPADLIVSPDALALVRFGLRAADDERIVNTVKVIDALLKVDTPFGSAWHRYNQDGYGEHEDGSAFDGTGIGRAWPLLTGERAHYELAAGRRQSAIQLMQALERFASDGGLLPEQIWDGLDIPEKELFLGRPSGSAMPLVWAHAEYIKLLRSLRDGRVFDTPRQTYQRYVQEKTGSAIAVWRANAKRQTIPVGRVLRVEMPWEGVIEWSSDEWQTTQRVETRSSGLGMHYADLATEQFPTETNLQIRIRSYDQSLNEQTFSIRIQS